MPNKNNEDKEYNIKLYCSGDDRDNSERMDMSWALSEKSPYLTSEALTKQIIDEFYRGNDSMLEPDVLKWILHYYDDNCECCQTQEIELTRLEAAEMLGGDTNFAMLTGIEIEDYLNNSEDADVTVAALWEYVRGHAQSRPYDYLWFEMQLRLWALATEVLAAIVRSYNDWYSDFEVACLEELAARARVDVDAKDDDGESYWGSYDNLAYEIGKKLNISL